MRVRELLAMLRDCPPNARVVFETPEDNAYEVGTCSEDPERLFFVMSQKRKGVSEDADEPDWMEADVVVLRNT